MTRWLGLLAGASAFLLAAPAHAVTVEAVINEPKVVGETVEFVATAVGTGGVTYTWDFGDGHTSEPSTSGFITHVYEEPGHYPVLVVARDESGARSDSFLQTVHRPLPDRAPTSSSTIVHVPARGRVCNVNADNDSVSCVSTESLELVFEAPVGRHPRTLASTPDGRLWVVNQDDATVSVLDEDGAELETIALPRGSKPFGIALSPAGDEAYVTLEGLGELVEIEVSTRTAGRRVDVGPFPAGVAVSSDGARIFVSRWISPEDHGVVTEVEAGSFAVAKRHELAMDPGPDTEASARGVPNYLRAVVPTPDGAELWLPSKKDNVLRGAARDGEALTFETSVRTIVSFLDLATDVELLDERVDINNRALGLSVAFSPRGDYGFVALLGNNGVEVLDAYDRRIVAGQFELGKAPDGLVLDDAGRLYVNAFLSRSVVVLDAAPILASTDFQLPVIEEIQVSFEEKLPAEVLAGKRVFYDASDLRMTADGYISCASCHLDGFEDGRVWDFTDRGEGLRNTTSLLGKRGTGQGRLHWSANFDEIQDFEHDIRGAFGGSGFLPDAVFEEGTRNTTLGDPKAGASPELDAMAAYVASLDRVNPSPYRDPDGTLTEAGWRGRDLFLRAECDSCHGGPDFTDSASGLLHDVGTITGASGQRLGETLVGLDTPTLRGVWETAPYLHDGSAKTLLDVLTTKNPDDRHGGTGDLSPSELEDLVSYLLQIDDTALEDEPEEMEPMEPEPMEPEPMEETGAADSSGSSSGGGSATTSSSDGGGCSVTGPARSGARTGWWLGAFVLLLRRGRGRRASARR